MQPIKHITSPQNPLTKKILALKDKSRERKKTGLFILEGRRELQLALKGNYKMETIVFCDALIADNDIEALGLAPRTQIISVNQQIYGKLAHRNTTEGIMAIAKAKPHGLEELRLRSKNPLILVAEAPEKPGNIGALLRTADAADLDAVIIANPKTDLYNPNTIRSSVGCVFTRQIALAPTADIIGYLGEKGIAFYCATLQDSTDYLKENYTGPTAIVVGTEDKGLGPEWLLNSKNNVLIEMEGQIDSMNVSVSAAILIFEAKRQRKRNNLP